MSKKTKLVFTSLKETPAPNASKLNTRFFTTKCSYKLGKESILNILNRRGVILTSLSTSTSGASLIQDCLSQNSVSGKLRYFSLSSYGTTDQT